LAAVPPLIAKLQADWPDLHFEAGQLFCWSPKLGKVFYKSPAKGRAANWSLLHEVSHALLGHRNFEDDLELVQLEAAAWQEARQLAQRYGLKIDENYIEDCLDTYRDWLHLRAACPKCGNRSLQASTNSYECFNCQAIWRVSRSRQCRPYRLKTSADF
jgi:hypothetical protein